MPKVERLDCLEVPALEKPYWSNWFVILPVNMEAIPSFTGVGKKSWRKRFIYRNEWIWCNQRHCLSLDKWMKSPGAECVLPKAGWLSQIFRDVEHKDVLLFIDNIFRFVQAGSEVSSLLGRMPSAVGYQPTLANEMGQLQERILFLQNGSVHQCTSCLCSCGRFN